MEIKILITDLNGDAKWLQLQSGVFLVDPEYLAEFSLLFTGKSIDDFSQCFQGNTVLFSFFRQN